LWKNERQASDPPGLRLNVKWAGIELRVILNHLYRQLNLLLMASFSNCTSRLK